jgi:hypothetical protein
VHLQGAHANPLLQATATAAQERTGPGRQLLQAEGLAQHVVGTGIEQRDHRLRARAGCEHHHRTTQLGCQPKGRALIQQFGTDQQIGGLLLANLEGFPGCGHSSSQMAVLAQPLGQDSPQGAVGINDKHPLGLDRLGRGGGLGLLDHHWSKVMGPRRPNGYQAMPCQLARG